MGKASRFATHEKEFKRLKSLTTGLALSMLKPDQVAHIDWLAEKLTEAAKEKLNTIPFILPDQELKNLTQYLSQFLLDHFIIVPVGKPVQDPMDIIDNAPKLEPETVKIMGSEREIPLSK